MSEHERTTDDGSRIQDEALEKLRQDRVKIDDGWGTSISDLHRKLGVVEKKMAAVRAQMAEEGPWLRKCQNLSALVHGMRLSWGRATMQERSEPDAPDAQS